MKKFRLIMSVLIISSLAFFFTACNCIEGTGPIMEESRNLSAFNSIRLRTSADVFLKQDSVQSFNIHAQENILDVLTTEVKGDKLIIDTEASCITNTDGIEIEISTSELTALEVDGSGSFTSVDKFNVDELDVEINGSGDVMFDVFANKIETEISGSGTVNYRGATENHRVKINGSGDVNAYNLDCFHAIVKVSGSGDCELNVQKSLEVKVSGSGDVYYKGNPNIRTNINGSGSVNKR